MSKAMNNILATLENDDCRLIFDGPNEMINSNLVKFKELNEKDDLEIARRSKAEAKINTAKNEKKQYARTFNDFCLKFFNLKQPQLQELIAKLRDSEVNLLEEKILKKLKNRVVVTLSIFCLTHVFSVSSLIYSLGTIN